MTREDMLASAMLGERITKRDYHKMFNERRVVFPIIKKVVFNYPATVVYWADDTRTVVKVQHGDQFDPEKGLAMAIAKKAFGNKGSYFNEFKKFIREPGDDSCQSN